MADSGLDFLPHFGREVPTPSRDATCLGQPSLGTAVSEQLELSALLVSPPVLFVNVLSSHAFGLPERVGPRTRSSATTPPTSPLLTFWYSFSLWFNRRHEQLMRQLIAISIPKFLSDQELF